MHINNMPITKDYTLSRLGQFPEVSPEEINNLQFHNGTDRREVAKINTRQQ